MSNIDTNWFYVIDKTFKKNINIANNIYVSLFIKDFKNDLIINIWENSKVYFYWIFFKKCPKNIIINQNKNNSYLNFKSIFRNKNCDLISNISSLISSNNSKAFLNIIWIVQENNIWINSSIKIEKNYKNIEAKLDLENIFIWNNWTIYSVPSIFIESDDIKINHSSKSHRIDEQKLFYLKSRWLEEEKSIKFIIQSYFQKNFSCLEMFNKQVFKNVFKEFFSF